MKPKIIFAFVLSVSFLMLSANASADSGPTQLCVTWTTQFVDSAYGEDYFNSRQMTTVPARYARAKLVRKSNNAQIWKGNLDGNGCTPVLRMDAYTSYVFTRWTIAELGGSRRVFVNKYDVTPPSKVESKQVTYTSEFKTGSMSDLWNPPFQFGSAYTSAGNLIAVASQALAYYSTREYPANTDTVITVNPSFCWQAAGTYYLPETGNICINRNYTAHDPNNPMDHSTYKFVVAHEIGHRLAEKTGAPLSGANYTVYWQTHTPHVCNCLHLPGGGSCMQSRSSTGKSQQEAWANFYAMALFNDREPLGVLAYFRSMYKAYSYPGGRGYVLDTTPPVPFWGGSTLYEEWMKRYCVSAPGLPSTEWGNNADWTCFFWRMLTYTTYPFSVSEMSSIWRDTEKNANGGGHKWADLRATVISKYGNNSIQLQAFDNLGQMSAVNY